ncbi:MAG: ribonuclease H-like domain-containing protein [Candidatus Paceibacterota bacterium]
MKINKTTTDMKTQNKPRILLYDLETSYTVGAVWGLYDQNVAVTLKEPYIITFAWKWLGEKTTHVLSLPDFKTFKKDRCNDKELVQELWKLFNEADVIIAHNGNSFDQKWTYARFVVNGIKPPAQAKYIDTKLVAKSKFRFNSNSLNNLGKYFGLGQKIETGGIDLWVGCIERNEAKSWNLMCKYNKQDVVLLEKVYLKMLPFMTNHPNYNLSQGTTHCCPNCGSANVQKRGVSHTRSTTVQRYQCQKCGGWSTGTKILR